MTISKIKPNQKETVLGMMIDFYNSPAVLHRVPQDTLIKCLDDSLSSSPYVECYVLENDNELAGFATVSKGYSTEAGGMCVQIEDLYVLPQFRGKHIGGSFLEYIERTYKNRAVRLRLEVEPTNERAIALYEKCGFCPLEYKQMIKSL